MHRIFTTSVASVYPHYVRRWSGRGARKAELDEVIEWLTGFDDAQLQAHLDDGHDVRGVLRRRRSSTRTLRRSPASVCGVRVEEVEDPLMQKIRYLDKLVDELAKGRPMEKVLRG